MQFLTVLASFLAVTSASAIPLEVRQADSVQSSAIADSTPTASGSVASGASTSTLSATAAAAETSALTPPTNGNETGGTSAVNDTTILQYALTLEHLEATFYNQSIGKFSEEDFTQAGLNSSDRNQLYAIGLDEAAHVDFLTKALGPDAVDACEYDFSSVTDVASLLATARVLEGVGVSAYLGAAPQIENKTYLAYAASVTTVESRHSSIINTLAANGSNAVPAAFDTPVPSLNQIYSLAAPFIKSCPADLGLKAFPSLNVTASDANVTADSASAGLQPGAQVNVVYDTAGGNNQNATADGNSTAASSSSNAQYLAIISGPLEPTFVEITDGSASLPMNGTFGGQAYAVVTSSNDSVTDSNTLAGPAVLQFAAPLPEAPAADSSSSATATSSLLASSASSSATSTGSADTASLAPTPTPSTEGTGGVEGPLGTSSLSQA